MKKVFPFIFILLICHSVSANPLDKKALIEQAEQLFFARYEKYGMRVTSLPKECLMFIPTQEDEDIIDGVTMTVIENHTEICGGGGIRLLLLEWPVLPSKGIKFL